ncbi:protein lev-9-like [Centruroides sculpturatus]|uniref:protein lev-9-like n=1 Tax=Centruroides sculpturatus TaxID=218467 RepID=UPI000C6D0F67|nr:protein lev-9-like [Centruroides sculpturatus]
MYKPPIIHLIFLLIFTSKRIYGTESPVIEEDMEHQLVDPEGCPRDREEAASTGRQCLRKCQSDGECISSRKRCLCDGLCGWSCVRPDLHCDELTAIENGQFKVTGDHFGARVHYTCDEAFWMSGSKERVCQGDGSWSDRSPECRRKGI